MLGITNMSIENKTKKLMCGMRMTKSGLSIL
ncbi:hypothetical protein NPD8_3915 (plasmid) [Clostridium botulinum]|uniref:Uncharacterized protein n=1 Tax=Clostridium botulinum TaxID=1491 RepID=A0A1L7JMV4_CLOBO|nr:hypothetical protein NPD8_3915 [Clostridium botulinum]